MAYSTKSKTRRFLAFLLVFSGNIHSQPNAERPASCPLATTAYFSCALQDNRVVTLCAEKSMTGFDGRFLMMHYPKAAPKAALQIRAGSFSYNQYARYQVEYLNISTSHNDIEYRIFKNYDESVSKSHQYGIIEVSSEGMENEYECIGSVLDKLNEFRVGLRCDRENALGCID